MGIDWVRRFVGHRNIMGRMGKKVLTSLVHPERGAQVTVNNTLGCGHFYKGMNNTIIS